MRASLLYLARTVASSIALILAVVVLLFLLLELAPGDRIQAYVGDVPVSEAFRQEMTERLGLDEPVLTRLLVYLGNVITGDFGDSFIHNRPVIDLIFERLGATLAITLPALVLSSIGGIILGVIAARTRNPYLDNTISIGALAGFSIPNFWFALVLILTFSIWLGWLPAQGMAPIGQVGIRWQHLILPIISLTAMEMGFKTRIMRSSMIEVLGQDYIDTARSKGLSSVEILRRHGVLNSLLPMVSVIGYSMAFVIAGSVVIEKVFAWPGMGLLLYDSITRGENLVVIGILIIMTVLVVVINALTDIVYGLLDPRVRARNKARRSEGAT